MRNVYDEIAVATYPKSNPMMFCGTAWDVAETCAYLGSPSAAFITGQVVHVAGGGQLYEPPRHHPLWQMT